MLNQLLPILRNLFHLSGSTKHWKRFASVSCCKAAPFMESCGSLRVPPEALSWGICWEQACQCFHKDRNQLCQENLWPGTAPNVPKHNPCMKKRAAAILSLLIVRTCSFQFLLRSNFSSVLLVTEGTCLAGARGIQANSRQVDESVSAGQWLVQGLALNPAREESRSVLLLDLSHSWDPPGRSRKEPGCCWDCSWPQSFWKTDNWKQPRVAPSLPPPLIFWSKLFSTLVFDLNFLGD